MQDGPCRGKSDNCNDQQSDDDNSGHCDNKNDVNSAEN